jgi:pyrroloquinoline quinone biosynthesis protein B
VPNQLSWVEIHPGNAFTLPGNVTCTPIPLPGSLPTYAHVPGANEAAASDQALLGILLEAEGLRLAYTPAVPEVSTALRTLYDSCDAILVDGTFWSDTELNHTDPATPLARAIGHVPMSGEDGTLALLSSVRAGQKIFIHINNTNPVLDPRSDEYKFVIDAGWQIGQDGWQLN